MAIHFPVLDAATSIEAGKAPQPNSEGPVAAPELPVPAAHPGPRSPAANAAAADMFAGLYDEEVEHGPRRIDELLDDEDNEKDHGPRGRRRIDELLDDEDNEKDHGPLSEVDVSSLMDAGPQIARNTRFYHATRARNLGGDTGILNQGLGPNFGGSGAAAGDAQFEDQSKNKVHVTGSRNHGEDYREFFETGVFPWNSEKRTEKSPAELLRINLPKDMRTQLQQDPDDKLARTLDLAIPPENIKPTSPAPLPGEREAGREADYDAAFRMHQARGTAENEALYSNMSPEHQAMIDKFPEAEERGTAMQMLKQGLMSAQNPLNKEQKILP